MTLEPPEHVVETLSENDKVGVSVCVFVVIFPHTWGTRIEVLDLSRSLSETVLRFFFSLPCTVCCHCHLDIWILKMKLLSNILAPVSCVTVFEGTKAWYRSDSGLTGTGSSR
jgi:hypothetical protein